MTAETLYEALPRAARDRLRIRPGGKDVLLRVVLRGVDGTFDRRGDRRGGRRGA